MDQNTFVGNDSQTNANQSLSQAEGGNEQKIDPGAIRKSTTQNILNALSNASGSQFGSVEEALAFMARTGAQTKSDGNAQPVDNQQNQNRSGRVTTNDLQEQFSKLQQDLSRKEQALREKELDSDIQRAMGEKFDSDLLDYALNKVKSNIQALHFTVIQKQLSLIDKYQNILKF
jgi:phenylalanyl-tRNA synthetase alpha subunit